MTDVMKELREWLEEEQSGMSERSIVDSACPETIRILKWTIERLNDLENQVEDLTKQRDQLGHLVSEFAPLTDGPCVDGCEICTQFAREMDENGCMEHVFEEDVWWWDE